VNAILRITVDSEPLERIEADAAVAGFFQADRPLRGAAGRADWRLCGMLSELVEAERMSGASGEAVLIPTSGRLRAPRLLVLGLGDSARFGAPEIAAASRDAVTRLVGLGISSAALGIPGEWIGAVPTRPSAEAVARGALEALSPRGISASGSASGSASEPRDEVRRAAGPFCLRLAVGPGAASRALRGLEAAVSRARTAGVSLELPDLSPEPGVTVRQASSLPGPRQASRAPGRP
jgi:hypothetical protein